MQTSKKCKKNDVFYIFVDTLTQFPLINICHVCLPLRSWTWSSPTSPCAFLSLCLTSSTPQWLWVAGNTLTCSRSSNSPLCMTRPFFGRTASAAHRRPSFRVRSWSALSPPHNDISYRSVITLLLCAPSGAMYPTSMRINEEGRLVVNFKTEARFRGQFVMSHPGTPLTLIAHSSAHSRPPHTHSLPEAVPCGRSAQPPASY